MNAEQEEEVEAEARRSLEFCRRGYELRRVKNGHIEPARLVSVTDENYFRYHSQGFWRILPEKLKSVVISELFEVRKGYSTDNLKQSATRLKFRKAASEDMCFSVVFTKTEFLHKSVDFIADSTETRNKFFNALEYLINNKKKERLFFDEKCWLKEKFKLADTNKNGTLSFVELWKLLQQLNLELSEDYARKLFRAADTKRRDQMLDEDEFVIFFERLTERRDLRQILRTYSSAHQETFTPTDLMHFLVQQQHFEEIDGNKARDIVQTFERAKRDEQQPLLLGPLGFRHLLRAQYGNIFKPGHETVFQDMDCPLNYYYVNSSHNTYLTGLQLAGMASIEGYINALTKGARLLELDIFDGDDGEPCITHKHTLVDAIRLRDALTTIEQYAFKYSPYPVILTIENHVGLVQQKVMFRIFNEVFGDKIYISPPNSATSELPSPNALKNKFLVRGKKLPHEVVNSQSSDDDSAKQVKLDPEFSRLISLPSVKITNNADNDMRTHPMDGSPSLSESKIESIFQSSYNLPAYTARRFVKSYPSGFRQNSSNMDPFPSWLLGVQSVALNMQTADKFLDLNTAMFRVNGNCGYVLKPDILRRGLDPRSLDPQFSKAIRYVVQIISAQYLPKPNPSKDIVDPYVTIETHGIPQDVHKYRTIAIHNNGFNPVWNEKFYLELSCPQLAILRFCIKDEDPYSSNDFIGEFSIPVSSIREGYSHVRLNTGFAHTVDPAASLFLRITLD